MLYPTRLKIGGLFLAIHKSMNAVATTISSPYQRILDGLNSTILLFGADLRLRYINPAGEMLFEVSARHLTGLHFDALFNSASCSTKDVLNVLNTVHPITQHEVAVTLLKYKDITVDMSISPMLDSSDDPEILLECHQIDHLLRISQDEKRAEDQQATKQILRGLAHEIKNPLGGLRGSAQLLQRQLGDENLKEYTRVIIDEADRLSTLVDRMVGPSKIPQTCNANIHEILEHVRQLILADTDHEIYIQRDYDPSIPDMLLDPGQVIQSIINITRNAIQAISEQQHNTSGIIVYRTRVLRNFTIGSIRHRLALQLEIEDNGPGIPSDLLKKIFFPMVTGRATGTGLGLSIAQSIIQQHHGLLECKSKPNATIFTINLPINV